MFRSTIAAAGIVAVFAADPLVAQTQPHLVGLTRATPLLHHRIHQSCTVLANCPPAGFPSALPVGPFAGGTGWDPTRSGAWITNGVALAKVDDNCNYMCPIMPFPGLGPNAFATGLEVVESQGQLWMIDSLGLLHRYQLGCPPVQVSVCQTPMVPQAPQWSTTGLAVDEGMGLVFISYADFATNTNWVNVSLLANPCQVLQRIPIAPPCPTVAFGAITGLAVDWCAKVLYATDGFTTVGLSYVPGVPLIAITGATCCTPPIATLEPMIGLAVRPGQARRFGQPCANGACAPCAMTHHLVNDPNLGNFQFALGVSNAPSGSLAWAVIGAGPCTTPGTMVPPLCGPIYVPMSLGSIGPVPTGGAGGCSGNAVFNLGLPVIPGLCGQIISSQCVAICSSPTGAIGTSVSNCLSFQLQGN